ncbi:hypothetical protein CF088_11390 [Clostridium botulinum]|uniref:phage replisome organizer N-terminal domain-containing protein n=2 Tax=Clostridium botulinum TaxID=1491 RepID=UPI0007742205|nr:phage replisome organizer N-terminal domain-containing protein [Clostridium botulinum]APH24871.1 hypothetical protein NPD1_2854 [Clostridium botulinum]APQ68287.1 hypothetical protein RSJ8_980 [Clostridium botulinum]MBN3405877.1 hypothetical protein [Clostridium botulinum]QDY17023.1 hypothetical protein CGQ27_07925 [Clostridium botulinum]
MGEVKWKVKWIKIVTDIFDDEKILLIENMPEADSIIVIWFKLLCLAGKMNNSGVFMLNEKIAYTDEMLATIFRRPLNTVRLAINTFEQFGMIEVIDNVITIPNWSKHQTLDQLEERKEYMREYMREYREKQKLLATGECKVNSKINCKSNSKANVSTLEGEEDIEEDIEEEKDKIRVDWNKILKAWNELSEPIKPVRSLTDKRKKKIKTRMKNLKLTEKDILKAIDKISKSNFCKGVNNKGWTIEFDWLFKDDNNITKVLEDKYINKEGKCGDRENNPKDKSQYDFNRPYTGPSYSDEDINF